MSNFRQPVIRLLHEFETHEATLTQQEIQDLADQFVDLNAAAVVERDKEWRAAFGLKEKATPADIGAACEACKHTLQGNLHGPDQNDFEPDEAGGFAYRGVCTYCRPCRLGATIIVRGDRGFHGYGAPFCDAYGATLEVYESSSAEAPHVWLKIEGGGANVDRSGRRQVPLPAAAAHLNEEQARGLMARLQAWLDEIPSRWSGRS